MVTKIGGFTTLQKTFTTTSQRVVTTATGNPTVSVARQLRGRQGCKLFAGGDADA